MTTTEDVKLTLATKANSLNAQLEDDESMYLRVAESDAPAAVRHAAADLANSLRKFRLAVNAEVAQHVPVVNIDRRKKVAAPVINRLIGQLGAEPSEVMEADAHLRTYHNDREALTALELRLRRLEKGNSDE